jgi:hypothetical protein
MNGLTMLEKPILILFTMHLVEFVLCTMHVATPLWPSVGVKPNTFEVEDLESFGTPECLELDKKGPKHLALRCSWCH